VIQTTDQLIDKIAQDFVWRRRELTDLRALVQQFRDQPLRLRVLIRGAVPLLYAHWEGFVKVSASHYLEYVASIRLPYRRLAANFVGLTLRAKFAELGASEKLSSASSLAEFFCTALDRQSVVPYKRGIDTKSNLSSIVLQDIIAALGLDGTQFATRLRFIDSNLVNPRNHIAHGEATNLTVDEYLVLHDEVIVLIETFRNEIENASVLHRYERA